MPTHQHRDENVGAGIFRTRLHPMSLAGGGVGAVMSLVVAWMIVRHNDLGSAGVARAMVYGTVVAFLWLVGPGLRYVGSEVVVRGDEVVVRTRPFGGVRSARVADIEDVKEHSGSLGRQLGYGTVVIYGRHGTGATLRHVRDSEDLRRVLIERARRLAGHRS